MFEGLFYEIKVPPTSKLNNLCVFNLKNVFKNEQQKKQKQNLK